MCRQIVIGLISAVFCAATAVAGDDSPLFRIREEGKWAFTDEGKWGFINVAGAVIIPPQYDDCYYQFSEGLVAVKIGQKWGYVDRKGAIAIPPRFDGACSFRNGLAAVHEGEMFEGKGNWGYIDKSGDYVLKPNNAFSCGGFHEGLMEVKVNGKWGYVDTKGSQVIPAVFDMTDSFSEGLAAVRRDKLCGFINTSGDWAIRLSTAAPVGCCWFRGGLAPVVDCRTGKCGYIDRTGAYAIQPRFDGADSFSEGLAGVCIEKADETGWPLRKRGYIDRSGKIVIPVKYEVAWEFREGMAKVAFGRQCGFVDSHGVEVIPCRFAGVEPFENGLAWVTVGSHSTDTGWSGYINKTGEFVWRPSNFAAKDKARLAEQNRVPTIRVYADPKLEEKGLLVTCNKKIDASREVLISVVNLLDEEVFLEVTGFDSLGYSLDTRYGGWGGGGGSYSGFPDNTNLLKRLHASEYSHGKRLTCACCATQIKGKLAETALELGPARGTVDVWIRGFYRSTGKEFSEHIELPIEIAVQEECKPPSSHDSK